MQAGELRYLDDIVIAQQLRDPADVIRLHGPACTHAQRSRGGQMRCQPHQDLTIPQGL